MEVMSPYCYWDMASWRMLSNSISKSNVLEIPLHSLSSVGNATFSVPFKLTGCMNQWPAMSRWNAAKLSERFGDCLFEVISNVDRGASLMSLNDFLRSTDPTLYIFDPTFDVDTTLVWDYSVPECFRTKSSANMFVDLFKLLPQQVQPDYRWFLLGWPGSGSSLHVDPLKSCAWNALVVGKKEWIVIPPDSVPPSLDQTVPEDQQGQPSYRFFQYPGEIIFIPSSYQHAVLNKEFSIAVTHNFYPLFTHTSRDAVDSFLSELSVSGRLDFGKVDLLRSRILQAQKFLQIRNMS